MRYQTAPHSEKSLKSDVYRRAKGSPQADLVDALALFHAAQERSSQFESLEERTELPPGSLLKFRSAALAGPMSPYLKRTWETLARILVRKRWIEEIYTYVQPVAEGHHPWPALEIALARADLESLAPGDAARRLEPLAAGATETFEVFELLGTAYCGLSEGAKALEAWKRAVELPTDDRVARRKLILAVARTGDPVGITATQRLLVEMPEDPEVRGVLERPEGAGPMTDPCSH